MSFVDKQTGLKSIINLDQERYKGREEQLDSISTWVDPRNYIIRDIDDDGIKEIIAVQRVFGLGHTDPIAGLKTTFKMENGCYKPVTLSLTTRTGDPFADEDELITEVRL